MSTFATAQQPRHHHNAARICRNMVVFSGIRIESVEVIPANGPHRTTAVTPHYDSSSQAHGIGALPSPQVRAAFSHCERVSGSDGRLRRAQVRGAHAKSCRGHGTRTHTHTRTHTPRPGVCLVVPPRPRGPRPAAGPHLPRQSQRCPDATPWPTHHHNHRHHHHHPTHPPCASRPPFAGLTFAAFADKLTIIAGPRSVLGLRATASTVCCAHTVLCVLQAATSVIECGSCWTLWGQATTSRCDRHEHRLRPYTSDLTLAPNPA